MSHITIVSSRIKSMVCSPFILLVLSILSSSIRSSKGFSTSRLFLSSTQKNRNLDGRNLLLQIATDPTTVTSHGDKDGDRSYDFISVEEAEEAIRRERARYEGERSELQWLLEVQRQQLKELAHGRREKRKMDESDRGNNGRSRRRYVYSGVAGNPSTRLVILGSHAHNDANEMNDRRKFRQKVNRSSSRKNTNNDNETYYRMQELEAHLQNAIVENDKLTRQRRERHHQYSVERTEFEGELQEELDRLNFVRDELHMERAYFETSRRMLENLLKDEQKKVRELEEELMIMISREQEFSQEKQSQDEYQQHQQHQQIQTEQVREEHTHSQINNEKIYSHQNRGRGRSHAGFVMNINDVQCPLYP